MAAMVSPTRRGIRSDGAGDGKFNAPRGPRRHKGVDFLCTPGQDLYMPLEIGKVTRKRYPYANDMDYEGMHVCGFINNLAIEILMFYCVPTVAYNINYRQGEVIGYAQDISKKYGPPMKPHVHLQIERLDPMHFYTDWWTGSSWDWSVA